MRVTSCCKASFRSSLCLCVKRDGRTCPARAEAGVIVAVQCHIWWCSLFCSGSCPDSSEIFEIRSGHASMSQRLKDFQRCTRTPKLAGSSDFAFATLADRSLHYSLGSAHLHCYPWHCLPEKRNRRSLSGIDVSSVVWPLASGYSCS